MSFDPQEIKKDFPALEYRSDQKKPIYLDNAATTHKPKPVLDRLHSFYSKDYATVHRGAYELAELATSEYEAIRAKVAGLINAPSEKEVVYTRGTTEAINLVANSFAKPLLEEGDEILIGASEHHSNIVPWQMIAKEKGAKVRVLPMNNKGELILDKLQSLLGDRTKIVCVNHVSNALGSVNPIREICSAAKSAGAYSLVDAAQSLAHMPVDVREIGCDFLAFSGHKIHGPTGCGALWGRYELLNQAVPFMGGGDMIRSVTFEKTEFLPPPMRFEAGTPPIAEIIGMGVAIDYIQSIGLDAIWEHERELLALGTSLLMDVPGLELIGTAGNKSGILSFVMEGAHPSDIATLLDQFTISVRAGHHCAQPVMDFFRVPATARASLALYNTEEDLYALADALKRIQRMF